MSKNPAIHKPKPRPCVIRMGETCENNCGGWAKTNQIPVSSKLWLKLRRLRVRVLTCADDGSHLRVVAQLGSALDWGSRGRWFESSPPDQKRAGRTGFFPCDLFFVYGLDRNRPQSSVAKLHVKPARACLTVANATPVVRRPGSGSLRMGVSSDHKFHPDSCRRWRHRKRAGSRLGARWHELTVGYGILWVPRVQSGSKSDKPQVSELPSARGHIRVLTKTAANRKFNGATLE